METSLIFHHKGSMGDIIYSLPTIKAFGGGTLWIRKKQHYNTLKRLIQEQPYIDEVINKLPEKRGYVNLDSYRLVERKYYKKGSFKHLAECHLEALELKADITAPWLNGVEPERVADIVINRSTRYHDKEDINWELLEGKTDITFVGLMDEFEQFKHLYNVTASYWECRDAYEMAKVIKGSKLFIGNQSLGFAIAEAMKHPRILEVYHKNANCMPQGENGYTYLDEEILNRCLQ